MSKAGLISPSPREKTISALRGFIERSGLRCGDRLPAENKLAAQFDVSRMTVRKALEVLEREGVVRRERNLGCVCALKTRPAGVLSRTIVLVTDHGAAADGNQFGGDSSAIVSGVISEVSQHHFNFLRMTPGVADGLWLDELIAAGTPGVIVSCWERPIEWQLEVLRRLAASGTPVVAWGESSEFAAYDRVASDHVTGAERLVHALAAAGSRNPLRLWTVPATKPWIEGHNRGYDNAVKELQLRGLSPVYVDNLLERDVRSEANFRSRVRYVAGYLAEHLRPSSPVDAIMVATDCEALLVLAACRFFGREDIRVTGYDNYWATAPERQWESGVPFATVDKNNHRLGEELASLLLQRVAGQLPPSPQVRLLEQVLILPAEAAAAPR